MKLDYVRFCLNQLKNVQKNFINNNFINADHMFAGG